MAASRLASIPDAELDAYIADLIVQKSKAKEPPSYPQDDVGSSSAARIPNTNKRFLSSVIRNVEGHNQALLRQQAREAACSHGTKRTKPSIGTDETSASAKLHAWSDDEGRSGARSPESSESPREEGMGLSSKMDKYFDEPPEASFTAKTSGKDGQSRHRQSSSGSSRHRERRRHSERDKDRPKRNRHGESEQHRSRSRRKADDKGRPHRSSHKERDDEDDDRRRRRRRREKKDEAECEDRQRSTRDRDRKRSASPKPALKVREWDLGKDSLAF